MDCIMKEGKEKGYFNCRCECCIYWRRHIHRVAANKDKEISKLIREKKTLKDLVIYWKWHHDKMKRSKSDEFKTIQMLRVQISDLKMKILGGRKPSIFERIFG